MHLARQHNVAEVLLHFITGLASAGASLPEPAAGGVAHQLRGTQPSALHTLWWETLS